MKGILKKYYPILLTLIMVVALILLKKPIEFLLDELGAAKLKSDLIAGIISRVFIVLSALVLISRWKLQNFNGFTSKFSMKNYHALLIPLFIIITITYSNLNAYLDADRDILLIFAISVLLIGLAEELTFRGIILPLFIRANADKKNAVLKGIIYSSLLFGLSHYINLLKVPDFDVVTSVVIFAFCFGTFAGGLFLRTGNIIPVSLIHALFNFGFDINKLKGEINTGRIIDPTEIKDLISLLVTLLVLAFIFASGIYMVRKSNKELVLKTLADD